MKVNTGSVELNVKYYCFFTNSYGAPTDEFKEMFIATFGEDIIKNDFKVPSKDIMEDIWKQILSDLEYRGKKELAVVNGGYEFYIELMNNMKNINSIEELELFIKQYRETL